MNLKEMLKELNFAYERSCFYIRNRGDLVTELDIENHYAIIKTRAAVIKEYYGVRK